MERRVSQGPGQVACHLPDLPTRAEALSAQQAEITSVFMCPHPVIYDGTACVCQVMAFWAPGTAQ